MSRSLSKFLRENPVTVVGIPTGSAVLPGSLLLCLVDIRLGCAWACPGPAFAVTDI